MITVDRCLMTAIFRQYCIWRPRDHDRRRIRTAEGHTRDDWASTCYHVRADKVTAGDICARVGGSLHRAVGCSIAHSIPFATTARRATIAQLYRIPNRNIPPIFRLHFVCAGTVPFCDVAADRSHGLPRIVNHRVEIKAHYWTACCPTGSINVK